MLTVALVLAGLAAGLHVYFFWLESVAFRSTGHRIFGVPAGDVEAAKPWAFNQGFYNLFLAIGTVAGMILLGSSRPAGIALVVLTTASMVAAALVLILSDRSKARGAAVQGTLPALSLIALAIWAAV